MWRFSFVGVVSGYERVYNYETFKGCIGHLDLLIDAAKYDTFPLFHKCSIRKVSETK